MISSEPRATAPQPQKRKQEGDQRLHCKPQRNAKMSAGTRSAQTCTAIESWEADEIASCQILLDKATEHWKQCALVLGPKPHYRDSSQASREYLEATKLVHTAKCMLASFDRVSSSSSSDALVRVSSDPGSQGQTGTKTTKASERLRPASSLLKPQNIDIGSNTRSTRASESREADQIACSLMKARQSEWSVSYQPDPPSKVQKGVPSFSGSASFLRTSSL